MTKRIVKSVLAKRKAALKKLRGKVAKLQAKLDRRLERLEEETIIVEALEAQLAPSQPKRGRPQSENGVVATAISEARRRGVTNATAGDVLGWFGEIGFETKTGPDRNAVYVSLNREAARADNRGVKRCGRGQFEFATG